MVAPNKGDRSMASKTSTSPAVKVSKAVRNSLDQLAADGRKVHVLGRVKDGKLELDSASLQELSKKFPNSTLSFVAVNAPFDPHTAATV